MLPFHHLFTRRSAFRAAAACAIALTVAGVGDAAPRTFVASYGNDANACSLGAPCRSFGTAITHTDADGEISVLDSAGYGRVTITKSVSIIAPAGIHAGISVAAGSSGVLVFNAAAVVALRGLIITGQPGSTYGIYVNQGARLYVENCTISKMGSGGLRIRDGETYVTDSTIRDNGGYGIEARDPIRLVVDRTRIERNGLDGLLAGNGTRASITSSVIAGNVDHGIKIDSDDGASTTVVSVAESSTSHNLGAGIWAVADNSGSIVRLAISRSMASGNSNTGIAMYSDTGELTAALADNTLARNYGAGGVAAVGAGVIATIDRNTIAFNAASGVLQLQGALLRSRGNNTIRDNANDVNGNLTPVGGD
jgi:hypothetical protein